MGGVGGWVGGGGIQIIVKSYIDVLSNTISVTRRWVGVKIPEKSINVTLERPPTESIGHQHVTLNSLLLKNAFQIQDIDQLC